MMAEHMWRGRCINQLDLDDKEQSLAHFWVFFYTGNLNECRFMLFLIKECTRHGTGD